MTDFVFARPESLADAVRMLAESDDARPIAGGTALSLLIKQRLVLPELLVSLDRIPDTHGIRREGDTLRIGALVTHRAIETSDLIRETVPLLAEVYHWVATVRLRNQATIGGGIAHADPAQDPPAALLVLDAQLRIAGPSGERELPIDGFFLDYYETALQTGEILTEIVVPIPSKGTGAAYLPFMPRSVEDYATIGIAARLRIDSGRLTDVRVAAIAAATTPLRCRSVEDALTGIDPSDDEAIDRAAAGIDVDPIDDLRGSADYKREMAVVFTRRAVRAAIDRARS